MSGRGPEKTAVSKEVHGCVEVKISPNHQHHQEISHQSEEVNQNEQHEEYSLNMGVNRQSKEYKLTDSTVVFHCYIEKCSLWKTKSKIHQKLFNVSQLPQHLGLILHKYFFTIVPQSIFRYLKVHFLVHYTTDILNQPYYYF